jgi:hypothetical protein
LADLAANNSLILELKRTIEKQNEVIGCLRSENSDLKLKVSKLCDELDDMEQYSRRDCVEIHGVPESKNENIQKLFLDVGRAIDFGGGNDVVSSCHRLKKRNNQATAGIIVKFTRREDAECFIQLKKQKGNLTTKEIGMNTGNFIFINPSLTARRRVLFGKARRLLKKGIIKYLWIDRAGRIKSRVSDGGPVTVIRSEEDLMSFTQVVGS